MIWDQGDILRRARHLSHLQPSLKRADQVLSALETEAYFKNRAKLANRDDFLVFLDGAGDEPPINGDSVT
jgi:hypothetical protein